MRIYRSVRDAALKTRPRAIAVGVFDGVHRGHQKILKRALADARRLSASPTVVTFDPHPRKIIEPSAAHPIILSLEHRLRFFESLGIAETLVIPFTKKFSKTTREFFLDHFLLGRLGMKALAVGEDFRFGRGGEGDAAFLRRRSREKKFELSLVRPLKDRGRVISSTTIRRLIEAGDLKNASRMLGRPVSVYGTVVRGHGRGRGLGFPTANLNPHHETLPPAGVYAVWGQLGGKRLQGVLHIGERPTFGEKDSSLEVHFLDFHGTIYGRDVELVFAARLRPIRRFSGSEALTAAIQNDVNRARRLLKKAV